MNRMKKRINRFSSLDQNESRNRNYQELSFRYKNLEYRFNNTSNFDEIDEIIYKMIDIEKELQKLKKEGATANV